MKKKWESENSKEPFLLVVLEESKKMIAKANPELRKSLFMGISKATSAIRKLLLRNGEHLKKI